MFKAIEEAARQAVTELLAAAGLLPGAVMVIGCSSSEVVGQRIGKGSSLRAAQAVYRGIAPLLLDQGIVLAAQCCEHLNRALILEEKSARALGLEIVNVVPKADAGGAFALTVYENLASPVAVERIAADAGLDIGGTLIGMHLRPVAVPVRLSLDTIGQARFLCARTRPKYIGGPRASYREM